MSPQGRGHSDTNMRSCQGDQNLEEHKAQEGMMQGHSTLCLPFT